MIRHDAQAQGEKDGRAGPASLEVDNKPPFLRDGRNDPAHHVYKHGGDLAWGILALGPVPLGKPVAHAQQTVGSDFGIDRGMKYARRLSLFDDLLEVAFVGFLAQDDFPGEGASQVVLLAIEDRHGWGAISGYSGLMLYGSSQLLRRR